jgi:hypothetical protein
MLEKLVLGAFFATLNGIGLYHPIPLTGITPTNKIWWRGLSSLEIVYSIHSLRKVHPYVFPEDDAVSDRDLFLQYSINLEEYEKARLALEKSIEAGSVYSNLPGVTSTSFLPSATAEPTYVYLDETSTIERYPQVESSQESSRSNTVFFITLVALLVINLMLQFFNYAVAKDTNQYVEDLQLPIRKQMMNMALEFQEFRRQNEEFRPIFYWLEETIRYCSSDLQRCLVHVVSMMEEKYTSSMIEIETKLDQVSQTHDNLVRNTETFPMIPKQLAWLNILVAKTTENAGPEDNPTGEAPGPHNLDIDKKINPKGKGAQRSG